MVTSRRAQFGFIIWIGATLYNASYGRWVSQTRGKKIKTKSGVAEITNIFLYF
jgi:hypothetical protein